MQQQSKMNNKTYRSHLCCRISLAKGLLVAIVMMSFIFQCYFWSVHIHSDIHSSVIGPEKVLSSSITRNGRFNSITNGKHDKVASPPILVDVISSSNNSKFNSSKNLMLPALSTDRSELILSSLIERSSHSRQLYITSFLLNTFMRISPSNSKRTRKIIQIHANFIDKWTEVIGKMSRVAYSTNGQRLNVSYYCKIWNSVDFKSYYMVKGEFVHIAAKWQRLDILRCPLILKSDNDLSAHMLSRVGVELFRDSKSIAQFDISWKHRCAGYMMGSDSVAAGSTGRGAVSTFLSSLNAWEGHAYEPKVHLRRSRGGGGEGGGGGGGGGGAVIPTLRIHLCVTGLYRLQYDALLVHRLVEFIEYHLLLGVRHFYFALPFLSDSRTFWTVVTHLKIYIDEGFISLTTTSEHRYSSEYENNVDSVLGLRLHRVSVEDMWTTTCLYLSRGVADYLAVWNIDEFFVPRLSSQSLVDIVLTASASWKSTVKFAANSYEDSKAPPLSCLIIATSSKQSVLASSHDSGVGNSNNDSVYGEVVNECRVILSTGLVDRGGGDEASCEECGHHVAHITSSDEDEGGYLFTLLPDQYNSLRSVETSNQFVKSTSLRMDDRVQALFHRSNSKIIAKFGKRFRVTVPIEKITTNHHDQSWKYYTTVYRPPYELTRGYVVPYDSGKNELSEVELLKLTSTNGYVDIEESFTRSETRSGNLHDSLPSFAFDLSDVALGSLIERKRKSWDLYVTTFMFHHDILSGEDEDDEGSGGGITKISREKRQEWTDIKKNFKQTRYSSSGIRKESYSCRIRNSANEIEYSVKGDFVPINLNSESKSNNKLEIFRCKMKHSKVSYQSHAGSGQNQVEVTIINSNDVPVFQFRIPWTTRRIGYMLSSPSVADSFQPWVGYKKNSSHLPGGGRGDGRRGSVYLSSPCLDLPISQETLPIYLEFMQHHYMIGVEHLFMSGPHAWGSLTMSHFLTSVQSFITDGLLTVHSQAGDHVNFLSSVLGASLRKDVVKVIYVNMCLYLVKGMVDYLAVWDIDEYFIPKLPHLTIMEVIRAAESPVPVVSSSVSQIDNNLNVGKRGEADGHRLPCCYLKIVSFVVMYESGGSMEQHSDPLRPWIGQQPHFSDSALPWKSVDSTMKTIIPTDRIYHAGIQKHGACLVDKKWRDKNDESTPHQMELKESEDDCHSILSNDAVLYQFSSYKPHESAVDGNQTISNNQYTSRLFPPVLSELTRRGLNVLVTLPDNGPITARDDAEWEPFNRSFGGFPIPRVEDIADAVLKEDEVAGTLPAFATDLTEMFLGAIIERSFDSRELHLTTFLLCHEELRTEKIAFLDPTRSMKWLHLQFVAQKRRYTETGTRNNENNLFCKITNHRGAKSYTVKGDFVPNKLSVDANANSKVDTLRCLMKRSKFSIDDLSSSVHEVKVEIFHGKVSLTKFLVPWKSRRVGFMLSAPSSMSRIDMWKNLVSNDVQTDKDTDVHLCVAGFESPMDKKSLAMYAEFLQHHFDLGVGHVHAGAVYKWDQTNMNQFAESFQNYISEGLLSIVSLAGDADRVPGWLGFSVDRDVVKVIYVNMCLYLVKGMVDYLAVWDIDEYFIPKLPHLTIMEVIRAAESPVPLAPLPSSSNPFELVSNWKGGRGWADGDGHAFCYLRLLSESLFRSRNVPEKPDRSSLWIGDRFNLGPEGDQSLNFDKSILPTRKIYQAGLHTGAGCKLDFPFSGCDVGHEDEFCLVDKHAQRYGYTIVREPVFNTTDFSFEQRFNGFIFDKDAKTINKKTEAVLYHIQIHRGELTSQSKATSTNDYSLRFYSRVLQNLRRRGLEIKVIIPARLEKNSVVDSAGDVLEWIHVHDL